VNGEADRKTKLKLMRKTIGADRLIWTYQQRRSCAECDLKISAFYVFTLSIAKIIGKPRYFFVDFFAGKAISD